MTPFCFCPGLQFEMGAFMPNLPASMRKPPPDVKAPVTLEEFLDIIPEMNCTSEVLSILWVLGNEEVDMVRVVGEEALEGPAHNP